MGGYCIVCICFFALLLQPVKNTLMVLLMLLPAFSAASLARSTPDETYFDDTPAPAPSILELTSWRHWWVSKCIRLALGCTGLFIGLFVRDLGKVFSLSGATGFAVI